MAAGSQAQELKQRIENRTARVGIIGLGYVGLPLALLFSEKGIRVTGFDIDEAKVTTLNGGGSYIVRISPAEIARARANGFEATSDYDRLREMDVVLICVPTPLNEYHEPDLSYITDTVKALAPRLRSGTTDRAGEHDVSGDNGRGGGAAAGEGQRHGVECRARR